MIVNNPLRSDRAAGKRARQLITDFFRQHKRSRYESSISEATTTETMTGKRELSTNHEEPGIVPVPKRISMETPDYFTIKLKMHASGNFDSSATGNYWTQKALRLNSVYEPFQASYVLGNNHQPNGFDKWSNIYAHYRVLRTRVILTCHNQSSTLPLIAGCGVSHNYAAILSASSKDLVAEMKHFEVQPVGTKDGGNGMVVFTRDIYPGEYKPDILITTGVTPPETTGDGSAKLSIWTQTNSNPGVPLYLVFGHTEWGANTAVNARWNAQVEYTVQFREWGLSEMQTED